MKKRISTIAVAASLLAAAASGAAMAAPQTKDMTTAVGSAGRHRLPGGRHGSALPLAGFGNLRNWTAFNDDVLYIQASGGQWYQVDLSYPCFGLPHAFRIGVDTGATNTLDSFSTVLVDGQRCPVANVAAIAAPPKSGAKQKS